jgi:DNA-binding CsgD family transcriptional regulator
VYVAACPHLVEAAVRTGERRPALVALRRFERWAGGTGDPAWLALVSRCHALVAEDIAEAEHHYAEALALHTRAGASFDHARTQLLYGQELRRIRRPAAAREQLVAALATLRRFDAGLWIDLATAELRATGQPVGPPDVHATGTLTPQQLKIARLAAAGATNREVAAQLFLSPRTIDHHMRNIFVRLGIRSRFDLARHVF